MFPRKAVSGGALSWVTSRMTGGAKPWQATVSIALVTRSHALSAMLINARSALEKVQCCCLATPRLCTPWESLGLHLRRLVHADAVAL